MDEKPETNSLPNDEQQPLEQAGRDLRALEPVHLPPAGEQPRSAAEPFSNRPSGPLLALESLDMEFGSQLVLRGINLRVERGQTLAVIGESGCGKTVLLKTMIGLLPPTRGKVLFDGRDLSKLSERELAHERTRYGFVFQQAALFDSMTIAQNIAFPLRQHTRKTAGELRDIVVARLAEVGLAASVMNKKPAEISGGMRKRVGLARALALEPEMVLYDEPTTGLDPIMSDVINELILNTRQHHFVTSVIVTHDMRTAMKVADRVVMFYPLARLGKDDPQMIYDGPPSGLELSPERRVTQFIRGEAGERLMEIQQSA
jgi:phospholipid/cholesterol/gamma-HCH transport system ATP-binding protein